MLKLQDRKQERAGSWPWKIGESTHLSSKGMVAPELQLSAATENSGIEYQIFGLSRKVKKSRFLCEIFQILN